jgi:hypothetical protein
MGASARMLAEGFFDLLAVISRRRRLESSRKNVSESARIGHDLLPSWRLACCLTSESSTSFQSDRERRAPSGRGECNRWLPRDPRPVDDLIARPRFLDTVAPVRLRLRFRTLPLQDLHARLCNWSSRFIDDHAFDRTRARKPGLSCARGAVSLVGTDGGTSSQRDDSRHPHPHRRHRGHARRRRRYPRPASVRSSLRRFAASII